MVGITGGSEDLACLSAGRYGVRAEAEFCVAAC